MEKPINKQNRIFKSKFKYELIIKIFNMKTAFINNVSNTPKKYFLDFNILFKITGFSGKEKTNIKNNNCKIIAVISIIS